MQDLIIVGAGGFGREMLAVLKDIKESEHKWNILGFIDDNANAINGIDCSHKVIGALEEWQPNENEVFVMAIASVQGKKRCAALLKEKGARFITVIHPTAHVSETTKIGEGLVLFPYAEISVNCTIGAFVFLNSYAQIGHDSVVGDYCTLCPKCAIAGGGELEEGVMIGTNASTYPRVKIGSYATVGMNSAVIRRVKPGTTVMGVPAKMMI